MVKKIVLVIIIIVVSSSLGVLFTKYVFPIINDYEISLKSEKVDMENSEVAENKINESIKNNYSKILQSYGEKEVYYALSDIEKDGTQELIIKIAESDSNYKYIFYKYIDNEAKIIGMINALNTSLYQMSVGKYLMAVNENLDSETVTNIYIENNEIKTEEVSHRDEIIDNKYTQGDVLLNLIDKTNKTYLENIK